MSPGNDHQSQTGRPSARRSVGLAAAGSAPNQDLTAGPVGTALSVSRFGADQNRTGAAIAIKLAAAKLKTVLEKDPSHHVARLAYAQLLLRLDDCDGAITVLLDGEIRNQRISEASRLLAVAHYRLADFGKAADYQAEAIEFFEPRAATPQRDDGRRMPLDAITAITTALDNARIPFFLAARTLWEFATGRFAHAASPSVQIGLPPGISNDAVAVSLRGAPGFSVPFTGLESDQYLNAQFGNTPIDVFSHQVDSASYVFGYSSRSGDARWRVKQFALHRRSIAGRSVIVPSPLDRYLSDLYGKWREQRVGQAFPSSAWMNDADPQASDFHILSSAYHALKHNHYEFLKTIALEIPASLRPILKHLQAINSKQ